MVKCVVWIYHCHHPCPLALTRKVNLLDVAGMPNNPRFAPKPLRRVELLAFPRVQVLDVTGPAASLRHSE